MSLTPYSAMSPLARAGVYSLLQRALGADTVRRRFVQDRVRPRSGDRILDLGCGPADILPLLGEVDYTGVDVSARYVQAAHRRFGDRGRFLHGDVRSLQTWDLQGFDTVISIGLLHHLDDAAGALLAETAAQRLRPGGRLVTLDPGRTSEQPWLARWLIERDRGGYIRTPEGYQSLISGHFSSVDAAVHHDLARVSYAHVMLECAEPRLGSSSSA